MSLIEIVELETATIAAYHISRGDDESSGTGRTGASAVLCVLKHQPCSLGGCDVLQVGMTRST